MPNIMKTIFVFLICIFLIQVVSSENTSTDIPEFVPTEEYQEVLEGQKVPIGLSYKIDFETGKKYARLLREDEKNTNENSAVLVSSKDPEPKKVSSSIPEEEKKDKNEVPLTKEEKEVKEFEFKEKVLLDIDDIPELHDYHKYTEEERKELIDKVWKQRQAMLEDAFKHSKTEMELLLDEMMTLKNISNIYDINTSLYNIEYLLQDIDNAEFFQRIKGYDYIQELIRTLTDNSTIFINIPENQQNKNNKDLYLNMLQLLGTLFKYSRDTKDTHHNHIEMLSFVFENMKQYKTIISENPDTFIEYESIINKYLYILGNLIRNKPYIFDEYIKLNDEDLIKFYFNLCFTTGTNKVSLKLINFYHDVLVSYQTYHKDIPNSKSICSLYMSLFTNEQANLDLKQSILDTFYFYFFYNNKDECIQEVNNNDIFMNSVQKLFVEIAEHSLDEEEEDSYFKQLLNEMLYMFPKLQNNIKQH